MLVIVSFWLKKKFQNLVQEGEMQVFPVKEHYQNAAKKMSTSSFSQWNYCPFQGKQTVFWPSLETLRLFLVKEYQHREIKQTLITLSGVSAGFPTSLLRTSRLIRLSYLLIYKTLFFYYEYLKIASNFITWGQYLFQISFMIHFLLICVFPFIFPQFSELLGKGDE